MSFEHFSGFLLAAAAGVLELQSAVFIDERSYLCA